MIFVKQHCSEHTILICLCDENLIGKTIGSNKISEPFYKGESLSEEEILDKIGEGTTFNIIGKESIDFALKHNFIKKENIVNIENVPHAQIY